MSRTAKFFFAMAWLLLGVVIGFLTAPIRKGVDITIASNNVGTDALTFCGDDDDDEDDDDEILETFDDED